MVRAVGANQHISSIFGANPIQMYYNQNKKKSEKILTVAVRVGYEGGGGGGS